MSVLTASWVRPWRRHNRSVGGWRERRRCAPEAWCQLSGWAHKVWDIISQVRALRSPLSSCTPQDQGRNDSCSRGSPLCWQRRHGADWSRGRAVLCKLQHLLVNCLLIEAERGRMRGGEVRRQGRCWFIWGRRPEHNRRRWVWWRERRRRPRTKWRRRRRGFVWRWSGREGGCGWGGRRSIRWRRVRWWRGSRFIGWRGSLFSKYDPSGRHYVLGGVWAAHGAEHVIQVRARRTSVRGRGQDVQVDGGRTASCPPIG